MEEDFLKYKNARVNFLRFGNGEKLLIAFHGFADQSSIFKALEESLNKEYTVYCLDLPFHGKTIWDKEYFDPTDISALFRIILKKENKERFDLMGFSLGGRIVQKMLFDWLPQIDRVFLIAPDGLNTKWLSKDTLIPSWFKSFLKKILQKPKWFLVLIKKMNQWGIINKFTYNFAYYNLQTEEKRNRLFSTWRSLDFFRLNPEKVKQLLKSNLVRVDMYFGNRDKVIPVSTSKILSEGMQNVHVHILEKGHMLVRQQLNDFLKEQLN